ncbi:MAG TPA: outer membrane beta-barrel protein [Gemmatimonadales bacterium]|nr:outer membrane beta-barrel protein [Gemmatimonadales bacterium]
MSAFHRALAALALVPTVALAQGRPVAEIGTRLGVTIEHASGSTLTEFGVPGAGILAQPTIYATFFAGPNVFIEPDLAFNLASGGGSTVTTFGAAANLGYLFPTTSNAAPYIAANVGLQAVSGGGTSHTEAAIGGRVGYRFVVQRSLALRLEAGYRRWLGSSHLNEITIGIGLGAVIHAAK